MLLKRDSGLEAFVDRLMMWHTFSQPREVMVAAVSLWGSDWRAAPSPAEVAATHGASPGPMGCRGLWANWPAETASATRTIKV